MSLVSISWYRGCRGASPETFHYTIYISIIVKKTKQIFKIFYITLQCWPSLRCFKTIIGNNFKCLWYNFYYFLQITSFFLFCSETLVVYLFARHSFPNTLIIFSIHLQPVVLLSSIQPYCSFCNIHLTPWIWYGRSRGLNHSCCMFRQRSKSAWSCLCFTTAYKCSMSWFFTQGRWL